MAVIRLFIALYPPAPIAQALVASLPSAADDSERNSERDTPPDQIHLTCHFIGDRDERQLREVTESLRRACSGLVAPILTPQSLITLPERGAPRLIAAQLDATPSLFELHRRLVTRFARPGKSAEHFLPHITLRRFGPAGGKRVTNALSLPAFQCSEVCLVKSVLRPGGASHAVIHREMLEVGG